MLAYCYLLSTPPMSALPCFILISPYFHLILFLFICFFLSFRLLSFKCPFSYDRNSLYCSLFKLVLVNLVTVYVNILELGAIKITLVYLASRHQ